MTYDEQKVRKHIENICWNTTNSYATAEEITDQYILIPKADLPEMKDDGRLFVIDGVHYHRGADSDEAWAAVKQTVARALYVDAHPPVDRRKVERLTTVLVRHFATPRHAAFEVAKDMLSEDGVDVTLEEGQ